MGFPVNTPSDLALDTYFHDRVTPGAASVAGRQSHIPAAPGQRVTIGAFQLGANSPVSSGIFVVFNAESDGDADLALTRSGRVYVRIDRSRTINFAAPSGCRRIDWIPEASLRSTPANETVGLITTIDIGMDL